MNSAGKLARSVLSDNLVNARFSILIVCCLFFCSAVNAEPRNALPKIRIDASGRAFETEDGKPFVPFGVNYFRPGTGWAPQLWKQFDAAATRQDFEIMKRLGVNTVRVFLTYGVFPRASQAFSNTPGSGHHARRNCSTFLKFTFIHLPVGSTTTKSPKLKLAIWLTWRASFVRWLRQASLSSLGNSVGMVAASCPAPRAGIPQLAKKTRHDGAGKSSEPLADSRRMAELGTLRHAGSSRREPTNRFIDHPR